MLWEGCVALVVLIVWVYSVQWQCRKTRALSTFYFITGMVGIRDFSCLFLSMSVLDGFYRSDEVAAVGLIFTTILSFQCGPFVFVIRSQVADLILR